MFNRLNIKKRGFDFGNLSGAEYPDEIEEIGLPDKVIIPLKQGFSVETECLVKKGDKVRRGQIIGRDDHSWSSPVHATINGVVEHFETFMEGHKRHFGVVIRRNHEDGRGHVPIPTAGSADKTREEISEILYLAGVTSLGATGIPSLHHTSDLELGKVEAIVINGLAAEPFALPQEKLASGRGKAVAIGLRLLTKLLDKRDNIHIALHTGSPFLEELKSSVEQEVKYHAFARRYPFEMDEIVTELTTGRVVPNGGTPSEVGVLVVTVQDILNIHDAVLYGSPLLEKTVALGGPAMKEPRLVRATVGTPLEWLIAGRMKDGTEGRILIGGAMRGEEIKSASHPVERDFSAVTVLKEDREREFLSFLRPGSSVISYSREFLSAFFRGITRLARTNIQGEARPCIYCSYCEDICPRGLTPHLYSRHVRHDLVEEVLKYGIEACIECGLCSFTCPSKILLLDDIREGKKVLEERGRWSHLKGLKRLEAEGKL